MNNPTSPSLWRLAALLFVLLGLSSSTAVGQVFFVDVNDDGIIDGGDTPFNVNQLEDAIAAAEAVGAGTNIIVTNANLATGSTIIELSGAGGGDGIIGFNGTDIGFISDVAYASATARGTIYTIVFDANLDFVAAGEIELNNVNFEFPGNFSIQMESGSAIANADLDVDLEAGNGAESESFGTVIFSGNGIIETADETATESIEISRLTIEEGATVRLNDGNNFVVPTQDDLLISHALDVSGTFDVDNFELDYVASFANDGDDADEDPQLAAALNISGSIVGDRLFTIAISDGDGNNLGDRFVATGGSASDASTVEMNVEINAVPVRVLTSGPAAMAGNTELADNVSFEIQVRNFVDIDVIGVDGGSDAVISIATATSGVVDTDDDDVIFQDASPVTRDDDDNVTQFVPGASIAFSGSPLSMDDLLLDATSENALIAFLADGEITGDVTLNGDVSGDGPNQVHFLGNLTIGDNNSVDVLSINPNAGDLLTFFGRQSTLVKDLGSTNAPSVVAPSIISTTTMIEADVIFNGGAITFAEGGSTTVDGDFDMNATPGGVDDANYTVLVSGLFPNHTLTVEGELEVNAAITSVGDAAGGANDATALIWAGDLVVEDLVVDAAMNVEGDLTINGDADINAALNLFDLDLDFPGIDQNENATNNPAGLEEDNTDDYESDPTDDGVDTTADGFDTAFNGDESTLTFGGTSDQEITLDDTIFATTIIQANPDNVELDRDTGNGTLRAQFRLELDAGKLVNTKDDLLFFDDSNLEDPTDPAVAVVVRDNEGTGDAGELEGFGFDTSGAPSQVEYRGTRPMTTGPELDGRPNSLLIRMGAVGDADPANADIDVTLEQDTEVAESIQVISGNLNLGQYVMTLGDSDVDTVDDVSFVLGNGEVVDQRLREGGTSPIGQITYAANNVNIYFVNSQDITTRGFVWPDTFTYTDRNAPFEEPATADEGEMTGIVSNVYFRPFDYDGTAGPADVTTNGMVTVDIPDSEPQRLSAYNVFLHSGTLNIGDATMRVVANMDVNSDTDLAATLRVVPNTATVLPVVGNDLRFSGQLAFNENTDGTTGEVSVTATVSFEGDDFVTEAQRDVPGEDDGVDDPSTLTLTFDDDASNLPSSDDDFAVQDGYADRDLFQIEFPNVIVTKSGNDAGETFTVTSLLDDEAGVDDGSKFRMWSFTHAVADLSTFPAGSLDIIEIVTDYLQQTTDVNVDGVENFRVGDDFTKESGSSTFDIDASNFYFEVGDDLTNEGGGFAAATNSVSNPNPQAFEDDDLFSGFVVGGNITNGNVGDIRGTSEDVKANLVVTPGNASVLNLARVGGTITNTIAALSLPANLETEIATDEMLTAPDGEDFPIALNNTDGTVTLGISGDFFSGGSLNNTLTGDRFTDDDEDTGVDSDVTIGAGLIGTVPVTAPGERAGTATIVGNIFQIGDAGNLDTELNVADNAAAGSGLNEGDNEGDNIHGVDTEDASFSMTTATIARIGDQGVGSVLNIDGQMFINAGAFPILGGGTTINGEKLANELDDFARFEIQGDLIVGSDSTRAQFFTGGSGAIIEVGGEMQVWPNALEDEDASDATRPVARRENVHFRNYFQLGGSRVNLGGNLTFLGTGDVFQDSTVPPEEQGVNGLIQLTGTSSDPHVVTQRQDEDAYFEDVNVSVTFDDTQDRKVGVLLADNLWLNEFGSLIMSNGHIETMMEGAEGTDPTEFEVYVLNTNIDFFANTTTPRAPLTNHPDVGANSTFTVLFSDLGGAVRGSRDSYVRGKINRSVAQGANDSGGTISSGYFYQVGTTGDFRTEGGADGDVDVNLYNPIVLQVVNFNGQSVESQAEFIAADGVWEFDGTEYGLEDLQAAFTEIAPFNVEHNFLMDGSPDPNGLELNLLGEYIWKIDYERNPSFDPNMSIYADGFEQATQVRDPKQIRILQFDCDATNPRLAGRYDLITGDGNDDPSNGLNDYISGVTFLTQEGVEVEACNIFAIATDINVNRLQFGGDAGAGGALTVNGVVTYGGGTALEGAVVSLMSGETEVATATTDASGAYSIAADAGVYTVMVTSVEGTATGVTSTDALAIVRDFAGIEALNGLGAAAADVNASGTTNSTDALLVAQKAVDPAVMFDAGEFISSEVNVTSGQVEADLAVVAYGDVNLSGGFEVTDEEGEGEGTTVAAKAGVTTANLVQIDGLSEATMGEAFDVPVRLSDAGTLGAFSLTFRYDAEQATFQGVSSALENVLTREIDGGVSVVWYNAAPEEALRFGTSDAFLTLNFAAAADAEGTFVLEAAGEVADNEANVIDTELLTESVEFGELPDAFALKGNYPNPFNPTTTIAFDLPEAAEVSVQVFDMLGRRVMTVPVQNLAAGASRTIQINGVALASGTYLYRLVARAETQSFVETGRMTLIK